MSIGDTLITRESQKGMYSALKLTGKNNLTDTPYSVFTTNHVGIFVFIFDNAPKIPLREVTGKNMKVNFALSSVASYVREDALINMRNIYRATRKADCENSRQALMV